MKDNEKKGIAILIIVAIVIIAIIFFATRGKKDENTVEENTENNTSVEEFVNVLEDGTKLNTSTKLNETKTVNGIEFGNIQLTMKDGMSVLLADVKNNSGKATELQLVDVVLLDKEGNEIVTLGGVISPLDAGEQTQFNSSTTLDYANAYDFKIVMK